MRRLSLRNEKTKLRRRCTPHGVGLVEGVVGMIAIATALTLIVVFITSVFATLYYKQKVAFVADQCAQYAASLFSFQNNFNPVSGSIPGFTSRDARTQTQQVADRLLADVGLPPSSNVSVVDDGSTVTCEVTVRGLKLPFVSTGLLLRERSAADTTGDEPPALLVVQPQSRPDLAVIAPCYGRTSNATPQNGWFDFYIPGATIAP